MDGRGGESVPFVIFVMSPMKEMRGLCCLHHESDEGYEAAIK